MKDLIDWSQFQLWEFLIFLGFVLFVFLLPKQFLELMRGMKNMLLPPLKESIPNWRDAPTWAQCLAQNQTGEWLWFMSPPRLDSTGVWKSNFISERAGYTKDTSEFKDSLQYRPL